MNKKQKKVLCRIILSALITLILQFITTEGWVRFGLYLIPYLIIGHDILRKAFKRILRRQVFDENFLMAVATLGALIIARTDTGDYLEAVAVMLFYQVGELFQSVAVGKSRRSIYALMDIRPDQAFTEQDGKRIPHNPDEIEVGSIIVVHPGEKIALDGIVVQGASALNTAALTGESLPRNVSTGDTVVSGSIALDGVLHVRTTKSFGESTVSKILDLVENASSRKSRPEAFITRFAAVYTPIVCISALLLALIPPMVMTLLGQSAEWSDWLYRALSFLVISCPCALVISIPLSFFAGLGNASRQGVLIKGSNYLETLSKTETVVFDKTGTLTRGEFFVSHIHSPRLAPKELLRLAALTESQASHPIARSIVSAWDGTVEQGQVTDVRQLSGKGIIAKVEGKAVAVGNDKLLKELGLTPPQVNEVGTVVYVAVEGKYEGYLVIADQIKQSAADAIRRLKKSGVRHTVMLTGDREDVARQVAETLGIDKYHASLLPDDKVNRIESLLGKAPVAFVGDGINDAPVLSRADIGIAMGAMGSDAAIEAADVVLMDDDPKSIVTAIAISRKCIRIVYQNIVFALGIKIICLLLGALGVVGLWAAIFADVGVMVLAVLNALRALYHKK